MLLIVKKLIVLALVLLLITLLLVLYSKIRVTLKIISLAVSVGLILSAFIIFYTIIKGKNKIEK